MGVPLAVLWGLLVFITNYTPYIGFWIALVPPVLLALLRLHADGPRRRGPRRETARRRRPAAGPTGRPVAADPGTSMMNPSPGET